jgi:hypothetical protein
MAVTRPTPTQDLRKRRTEYAPVRRPYGISREFDEPLPGNEFIAKLVQFLAALPMIALAITRYRG